ncbi:MAG: SusC/RagA family TonB-linked outer membrane protein [Bacteroidales bacterium]|nr:MAG: SusC/RagA family TonB-linked outer membrane protein [Bacteroidales bacterium]
MKKSLFSMLILCVIGLQSVLAQSREVSGVVTSADDGLSIPGVSVIVKGTTIGTTTDFDGNYSLNVPEDGKILIFSFVGMTTQELEITGSRMNVFMGSESIGMDEVMVVAYGVAKKSSFTGAAQTVSSDQITSAKVESLDKALAGKVSGVRVASATGAPGSSGDIQIRGIGSITGSTSPLYVIDGVAITSGSFGHSGSSSNILSTINPEDIASMTILKDAAAASLYGSRAANGVIIITTKKGKSGKTKFNFKANYGISEMATNSYEHMSGEAYYDYLMKSYENWYLNSTGNLLNATDAQHSAAAAQAQQDMIDEGWERKNGANWTDEVYGHGKDQDYQLSVSGGSDKNQYYISAGYKNVEGLVSNRSFERYSSVININSKAKDWFDLSAKAQLSYTEQVGDRDQSDQEQGIGTTSPLSMVFSADPTQPAYNEDGSLNLSAGLGKVNNPLQVLNSADQFINTKTYRALNTLSGKVQILPELSFTSINSVDYVNVEMLEYWGPSSINGESVNGMGTRDQNRVITMISSNVLNYSKTFNEVHNFSALAGLEIEDYEYLFVRATAKDYSTDKLIELSSGKADEATSSIYSTFMQSVFGSVNYNFANKYYFAASVRQDESSKLGKDNRKGTFWSASASWRFTEEDFVNASFLTDGKLRFSYGTNGTLPSGSYSHLGLYNFSGVYGPNSAIYLDQAANLDLGWEMSSNLNVGVDLTLFNKVSLSAEYFYKYTKDLLLKVPTSYVTGFDDALQNSGEISNQGLDIEIHANDILNSEFKWNADLVLSTLSAKVEKLPGGSDILLGDGNLYQYSEGQDLYTFYLPTWNGVNNETGFSEFLIDPTKAATAANLTMNYGDAGRGPVAKAFPDFSGGFTNTFSYKGFTLTALTTFQYGGNLFDYAGYFFHHDGVRGSFNLAKDVEGNYWTPENTNADNPQPVYGWANRPDRWSTKHIKSTDYIRLKEIGLSYNLPKHLYEKFGVNNVKVNLNVSNVAYLYAATKDMELEVNLNGYRTVDTPLARTYSMGVSVDF